MELDRARYIVRYYGAFMTSQERLANRHLCATSKITRGRSDKSAQEEAIASSKPIRELLSTDPEVKQLAAGGWEAFALSTAQRIDRMHHDEIFFNECPRCGKLAKTPKAKQCWHCHHDWHATSG
ncbi:MAG: hypothetical protein JO119_17695 [Acidobacteria bacterium]|nr:hypothetical protein [Acidobacteriota bacterium]